MRLGAGGKPSTWFPPGGCRAKRIRRRASFLVCVLRVVSFSIWYEFTEIYSFDHHFDADELYSQMIKKKYRVSRATIYNTLDLLVSLELVTRHVFKDNLAKYEKSFGFRQHDHIILEDNEIIEFCDPRIQSIKNTLEEMFDVKIKNHSLYFFGEKNKK